MTDMYSLRSMTDDRDLGTAARLEDFFVASDEEWRTFGVAGFTPAVAALPDTVDHLEVRVHDTGGEVLGAYSVTGARLTAAATLRVTGYLLDVPSPDGEAAWQRLRSGGLRQPGAWTALSAPERRGWLDAVRIRAATLPSPSVDVSGGVYHLDGRGIVDEASFLCAAGEAFRGPGGYFGGVLQAFGDCLHGGFGVKPPFELRWRAAEVSRAALGESAYAEITAILRAAGGTVTPLP
jgi:Barstar (barnase inhibitor)